MSTKQQGGTGQPVPDNPDPTESPKSPKNIVICSDGTGNRGGKARGTNVWGVFRGLMRHAREAQPPLDQIAIYDDGVGTQNFVPLRLLSGAFGVGINANVRRLYTELVQVFEKGDRIFLFGFSRGAYTVRCLAGFICQQGIVNRKEIADAKALDVEVRKRYKDFRRRSLTRMPDWMAKPEHGEASAPAQQAVDFLGVWDTVGAVGGPFPFVADILNLFVGVTFKDRKLNEGVRRARHALSIDDERKTFHPMLWERDADRIEQVWFPGVHTNVGGGYPKDQVAYVALDWLLQEAEKEVDRVRLYFNEDFKSTIRGEADECGKIYNSRAGLAAVYRYAPRSIEELCEERDEKVQVHESALRRVAAGTMRYAPANIPAGARVATSLTRPSTHPPVAELQRALKETDEVRCNKMKAAHAIVRKRQVLYWIIVAPLVLLLLGSILGATAFRHPTMAEALDSGFVSAVGALVPGFLVQMIASLYAYATAHPLISSLVVVYFVFAFYLKGRYENRLSSTARDAWKGFRDAHSLNPSAPPSRPEAE